MKKYNLVLIIALSMTLSTLWIPQGTCQFGYNNNNSNKNKSQKNNGNKTKKIPPAIYYPTSMSKPYVIPNVPVYPGKPDFKGGQACLNNKVSQSYIMNYVAKEKPKAIIDWYKGVLVQPQWTVNASTSQMISAQGSDGARLTIQVNQLPTKGSSYTLYYNTPVKSQ